MFLLGYSLLGYGSAALDSEELKSRAQTLISEQRGAEALGPSRLKLLLNVEDPKFFSHHGVDFNSKGAGATTLTQSLAKRLAFKKFKPGIGKIKQTAYAMSLEQRLTKNEILTLFLDSVPMGRSSGGWQTGLFNASDSFYGAPPSKITDDEYMALVVVMIAPSRLNHLTPNEDFKNRLLRIARLQKGECQPLNHRDVWLEGCK